MKAPAFSYVRPVSIAETVQLLADESLDARLLAGGQSLMPALNFRLDAPATLIDINRIEELTGITLHNGDNSDNAPGGSDTRTGAVVDAGKLRVRIGALTRHAEVECSPLIAQHLPLISKAIQHVAHTAVRNRGTFGGSIALADPAAELPACCIACNATVVVRGIYGERRVAADDFFVSLFETALQPGEMVVAVEFEPHANARHCHGFSEINRRQGDYAMAGLALSARVDIENRCLQDSRVVFFAVAEKPLRVKTIEDALNNRFQPAHPSRPIDQKLVAQVAGLVDANLRTSEDLHASAAMKKHLAAVLLKRVLCDLKIASEPAASAS